MDHAKWLEILVAGIVGIVVMLVIIPAIAYLFQGSFYRANVIVQPGRPVKEVAENYWKFPIRIINGSQATLKNVVAFITIHYDPGDLREDPQTRTYNSFPSEQPLTISWPGGSNGETKPSLDIREGETAILPLFRRYRMADQTHLLQVSAGMWAMDEKKGRTGNLFLNGAKEYDFEITLVADNAPPIIDQYRFNLQKADLLEAGEKPGKNLPTGRNGGRRKPVNGSLPVNRRKFSPGHLTQANYGSNRKQIYGRFWNGKSNPPR